MRIGRHFVSVSAHDIIAGLVTPVIVVTSTLSYVALIFSGPLADGFPYAIGFGLVSAALIAIVFAVGSGLPFAIAGPDSKPAAVLAVMAAMVAGRLRGDLPPATIALTVLAALVVGTLATGVALYVLGALRLGKWIRFVPYPVIGGFMAASGWLLTLGGLGLLAGNPIGFATIGQIAADPPVLQFATGLLFVAALWAIERLDHPFAYPILLVGAIALVHVALPIMGLSLADARQQGLLLDVAGSDWVSPVTLLQYLPALDTGLIIQLSGEFLGLVAVTVMTLLLSLVVIEVQSHHDVDVDRELRLNGLANLIAGAAGGMVGTISVSRTVVNYRLGALGRASGFVVGAVCLALLGFGTDALSLLPSAVLGGVLIFAGLGMLKDWLIVGRRLMPTGDFLQVLLIMLAIALWDFLAGVAIGIAAACVTFAINTSRIRPVRQNLDRSAYRSRVDRPIAHEEALHESGAAIQIMWLHGFIFFGSAHRLLVDVRELIETTGSGVCRSLILDFRQVLGIDSSAALSLGKLWNFAEREGIRIALSAVSPAAAQTLQANGLVGRDDAVARVFADVDSALEWCEDELISSQVGTDDALKSAEAWLTEEFGDASIFQRAVSYLGRREFAAGEEMFAQGAESDSLYLLPTGRVTIVFATPQGDRLRLRSMVGPTVLGEVGLYRAMPRGAAVIVDQPCVAYRLTADALATMERNDPAVASAFHRFIVRVVSSRLDFANREIAGLTR